MSKFAPRRPSASMIVAVLALVMAMSGSAVAASRLLNGDHLIRKGTLSGNRLRKHTLTGRQINLKKLGTVPSASYAHTAGQATAAGYATTAGSATSAGNADSLGGQPASTYLTNASRVGTPGIVKVSGSTAGTTATLLKSGPFTVQMTCTTSGADTSMYLSASTGEANSDLNGTLNPTPGVFVRTGPSINATASPSAIDDITMTLEAPSGAEVAVQVAIGVNSLGVASGCWANAIGIL
jgi:hypothetical protein